MRIVSLNTGLPREVSSHGQRVMTGIYKTPVAGRLPLRRLNFEGDPSGQNPRNGSYGGGYGEPGGCVIRKACHPYGLDGSPPRWPRRAAQSVPGAKS